MAGYIGVDGKAGKVMNLYVGVDGTARQVVKAYVGDENGKARLWFELEKISFFVRFGFINIDPGKVTELTFPSNAYVGMSIVDWSKSNFFKKLCEELERVGIGVEFPDERLVRFVVIESDMPAGYAILPSSLQFQKEHDGVTFDAINSFNVVDP